MKCVMKFQICWLIFYSRRTLLKGFRINHSNYAFKWLIELGAIFQNSPQKYTWHRQHSSRYFVVPSTTIYCNILQNAFHMMTFSMRNVVFLHFSLLNFLNNKVLITQYSSHYLIINKTILFSIHRSSLFSFFLSNISETFSFSIRGWIKNIFYTHLFLSLTYSILMGTHDEGAFRNVLAFSLITQEIQGRSVRER